MPGRESEFDLASGLKLVELAGLHGAEGLDVLKAAAEGADGETDA